MSVKKEPQTGGDFWGNKGLEAIVEQQQVKAAISLEDLMGGWPEEESVDDFLSAVREWHGSEHGVRP